MSNLEGRNPKLWMKKSCQGILRVNQSIFRVKIDIQGHFWPFSWHFYRTTLYAIEDRDRYLGERVSQQIHNENRLKFQNNSSSQSQPIKKSSSNHQLPFKQQQEFYDQQMNSSDAYFNVKTPPLASRPSRATGFNTPEVKNPRTNKFCKTSRVLTATADHTQPQPKKNQAEMERPLNIKEQPQIITRTARNVQLRDGWKKITGNSDFQ